MVLMFPIQLVRRKNPQSQVNRQSGSGLFLVCSMALVSIPTKARASAIKELVHDLQRSFMAHGRKRLSDSLLPIVLAIGRRDSNRALLIRPRPAFWSPCSFEQILCALYGYGSPRIAKEMFTALQERNERSPIRVLKTLRERHLVDVPQQDGLKSPVFYSREIFQHFGP